MSQRISSQTQQKASSQAGKGSNDPKEQRMQSQVWDRFCRVVFLFIHGVLDRCALEVEKVPSWPLMMIDEHCLHLLELRGGGCNFYLPRWLLLISRAVVQRRGQPWAVNKTYGS